MTASSTPCSRNQVDSRRRSLGIRDKSSPLQLPLGRTGIPHYHHQHFLVYVNSRDLVGHGFLPAWKRQNERQERLPTVTCYPQGRGRDTDWFKTLVPDQTRKRPRFIQSVHDLCRSSPGPIVHRQLGLIFIP